MPKLHLSDGTILTVVGTKAEAISKLKDNNEAWVDYTDAVDPEKTYRVNKLQISFIEE